MEKKEDAKYYLINLKNVLDDDGKVVQTWAVYENGILETILSHKKVFMCNDGEFSKNEFLASNASLIGVSMEEVTAKTIDFDISFALNTAEKVRHAIDELDLMEKSIQDSLNNNKKL